MEHNRDVLPDQFNYLVVGLQWISSALIDAHYKLKLRSLSVKRNNLNYPRTARMRRKMQVRYFIDKQRRMILTTAAGCVMFDDIEGHQARLLADPDFDGTFDQLIDTSTATKFDISAPEAKILAERPIFPPQSSRAFVATEPHIFGLALDGGLL